ncbi:hypothetical protein [Paeniglutamicibacter cryotolerans]|uniref:Uncharacterized protein n=1 Tax=Paeniglutamicibacter cryotolerans TaxID=670079 RepID=A0A839QY21_9MICC|nr:hypothetical protein [Paeniglutamicibacter cryotolerans]MBB2996851.1 hypothetical protein [Paeniglutamicibacter cryotolerans]
MDERMRAFLNDFTVLSRLAHESLEPADGELTVPVLTAHLGVAPATLPVVTESIAQHRLADAGQLLDHLMAADRGARLLGLAGQERHHMEFSDLLGGTGMPAGRIGEPDYETVSIGPDEETRVVSCGL